MDPLFSSYKKAAEKHILISITDSTGTIVHVNKKFCEISKYSEDELIGQNHRIINSGIHSKEFFSKLWSTILKGKSWNGEILNKAKDGSLYWVDTVIMPIEDMKPTHYISLRLDITRRKELEFKKEEYDRSFEDLFFMATHELQKPLSLISKFAHSEVKDLSQKELQASIKNLKIAAHDVNKIMGEMSEYISKVRKDLAD